MKLLLPFLAAVACLCAQTPFKATSDIDAAIEKAVANNEAPGAVALVWHQGKVLHFKAYGNRVQVPAPERMTTDTIFDAASLTKVIATTSSVMKLFEQGKIRLADKVTVYLPGFQGGKSDITVRQLLTHFSGLRPDLDLAPAWSGYDLGIRKALVDRPVAAPGERFIYSDINFILLGEIVHRVSGKPLDQFAKENIFEPLGMKDTTYRPPAEWAKRIAPTEHYKGMTGPLRGVVHDETTRFMGGLAGHAGLFTTAEDLARFAEMILNGGEFRGKRILSPLTIRKFTEPQTPPEQTILRGLGWDIDSPFAANRGELFPLGSFGHTGFTGTSIWMDPVSKTAVILLTNSVHPQRRPPVTSLRARVATMVAAGLGIDLPGVALTGYNETANGARRNINRAGAVRAGIDVLVTTGFAQLRGKRVGLITNHTGLTADGKRNIDVMRAGGVNLVALFSPEHGISGTEDHEDVTDAKDPASGVPVYSLYKGKQRTPNPEMLQKVDVIVFDIQDIGARFYTYVCTLKNTMEAAAKLGMPIVVLDRPNPINGVRVEGPIIEPAVQSFVGCIAVPTRHGMTIGELARMINVEDKINAKLDVVAMKGWQRGDWFDSTGLIWVDPSPNMRSLNAATLFPGVANLEYSTNYSVGRGTDTPFEQVGADWINGPDLATKLNARSLPGVRVYPTFFTPKDSYFKGIRIPGVRFVITDRERFQPVRFGFELAVMLEKLYPGKIPFEKNEKLIGSRAVIKQFRAVTDPRAIETSLEPELEAFKLVREKYLIYR
ncbi:MAG: DUF1343 domain-containing protein [Bryobacterales bacterium]|nr:DUF1343 domain-containing protein [Bryobacterales bacterium]